MWSTTCSLRNVALLQATLLAAMGLVIAQQPQRQCAGYCTVPTAGAADALIDDLSRELHAAKCALVDSAEWPADISSASKPDMHYDYVIVGGGTAGAIVASRLSENPNVTVLLLEAGGVPPAESEIFKLSPVLHHNEQETWPGQAVPQARFCRAMKTGACYWPLGKMLGGTGALNGNIFLRGTRANFERWQQLGNDGWSWRHVAPVYAEMMSMSAEEDVTVDVDGFEKRGTLLLNYFNATRMQSELAALVLQASDELGVPRATNLLHGPTTFGYSSDIPATVAHGQRSSTARRYLGSGVARQRRNLHVFYHALATRVLLNGQRRAVGVNYTVHGKVAMRVWSRHEVIVSAGSFNSAKLLMLSGIGPRAHLRSVGVPLQVDLPVGENLHDHGMMPLLLKFANDTANATDWSEFAANMGAQSVFDYFLQQRGDLASGFAVMGFINSTQPAYTSADTQPDLHLVAHTVEPRRGAGSFGYLGFSDELVTAEQQQLETHDLLQIYGSLLLPQSRGRVRLRSNNAADPPLIYNSYATHRDDRAVLLRYVRYVQRLTQTQAFRAHGLQLVRLPLAECDRRFAYDTDAYWLCYVEYFFVSAWHAVGTCRMAPTRDPRSVVDPSLRVKYVQGLRVIDASIMPEITSANTNGPTALIAEMGARMILNDYQEYLRTNKRQKAENQI